MQNFHARTDLAAEAHAQLSDSASELKGVSIESIKCHKIPVTTLRITESGAADALGKPLGTYYTVELDAVAARRENAFQDAALAISELLLRFDCLRSANSILVACLGNRAVTPDALGPATADKLLVTRHLKNSLPDEFAAFRSVSVWRTGVLGTTGVESLRSLKAICGAVLPDCAIAVDALASAELERLCRNVQICDSGICPGSGVGNDREAISAESLDVPVIALGVPTVIDAAALCDSQAARGLFVTPRNIDEQIGSVSKLLAYGLNLALHPGLSISDIDLLVE